ncbi:MAG: reductive dehalogenase [Bacteroidales bacterium]|nr:reductive dehalogenase [Bacteroidales bacterium]
MSNNDIQRRDFLKKMGIGSIALGTGLGIPKVLAETDNGFLVENQSQYGETPVEVLSGKEFPYQINPDILKSMRNRMTVFSRNGWDPIRREEMQKIRDKQGGRSIFQINMIDGEGKVPNQTRLDYALMQASWATAHMDPFYDWETRSYSIKQLAQLGPWNPSDINLNWNDISVAVKHASLFYGASLAGIAKYNPLWVYDEYLHADEGTNKKVIPGTIKNVIALAFEEDYDGITNSPGRLASAATGDGYSRMAVTAHKLAEFIRALGYQAIPAGNGTALSIPIAIDAGLGELGRNGLLVTPKYGPRVRIAKVFTDMPLIPDPPIRFGVKEFCEACMICANDCPSGSISTEGQTWEGKSVSNNNGTKKWYIIPETCNDYNGFSCSNCKRNCPFNKPNNSWIHKLIRDNIKLKSKSLDKVMVKLDQAGGYGEESSSTEFWEKDGSASITSREAKA